MLKATLCKLNWTCPCSLPCTIPLIFPTCLTTMRLLSSKLLVIDGLSSETTSLTNIRSISTWKNWKTFLNLLTTILLTSMIKIMLWFWARVPLVISSNPSWLSPPTSSLSTLWSSKTPVKKSFLTKSLRVENIFMCSILVKIHLIMPFITILRQYMTTLIVLAERKPPNKLIHVLATLIMLLLLKTRIKLRS